MTCFGSIRALSLVAALTTSASRLTGLQDAATASRLFPVSVAGQYGYIDSTGRMVIAPRFQLAEAFSEGLARVCLGTSRTDSRCGFIDATGAMVTETRPSIFSEGLAVTKVGDKWGYMDWDGRLVVTPRFNAARWFSERRAAVEVDGKWGYIDPTGHLVIRPQFEAAGQFLHGFAAVTSGGRGWLIDTSGTTVIQVELKHIDAHLPLARSEWTREYGFAQGRARIPTGTTWGYVDRTGRLVIPARFEAARQFTEGLAAVRLNGKWGYLDTAGTMRIQPQFDDAAAFSEGLAQIGMGRRGQSLTEWKWGYIDRTGTIAIQPQFMYTSDFSGGLACVHMNRIRMGPGGCERDGTYIDRTGRRVWEPKLAPAQVRRPPESSDTTPLEGTGALVERVAVLVDRAEAAEAGRPIEAPDRPGDQMAKANTQLAAHLKIHRDDSRALILSARLGRLLILSQPVGWSQGEELRTLTTYAQEHAPQHAALDRALALEPTNAEAHYWKGRLYGLGFSWKETLHGFNEPPAADAAVLKALGDSAVRYGRRAVELAPQRVEYAEALAVYLVMTEQEDEATTLLQDVAGGRHPLALLLADWKALPLPAGAIPRRGESQSLSQMARQGGGIRDYSFLRIRVFVLPMAMDTVQAFYRARWPGFRFYQIESQESGGTRTRSYAQHLRWGDGQVSVARSKGQVPDQPTDGISVVLVEITNPSPEVRERFPVPVGNAFCVLTFINARRFDDQ